MNYKTALVILSGLFACTAGCISEESIYREVTLNRAQAYKAWHSSYIAKNVSELQIDGKLSLEDALKLALLYNKSLQSVMQEREIARGQLIESYSEALPDIKAVGEYTRLDKVSSLGGITLGDVDNYSVDLTVKQPLFKGGAIGGAIRAARIYALMADEEVRGRVQHVIYDTAKAYYDVLLHQHLYEINRDAVVAAEAHLKTVVKKRAQGVASDFDVLRAETELSNFQAELIQQKNKVHLAKTSLLKVIGASQESEVTLSDGLQYKPMKPVPEEAVRLAFENRPDLYEAELSVKIYTEQLRIAKSKYFPEVNASFTQEWAKPDPHSSTIIDWGERWFAGITVEMPIFDGLKREGKIIQARAELQRERINLVDAQERALFEIKQAVLNLQDAAEFVESQKTNLQRAKEGLRLSEVGYEAGINTEVEVIDARWAHTTALGYYYQAVYDHTLARLDLQRATGTLGPTAGQAPKRLGESPIPKPGVIAPFMTSSEPGDKAER